jgi:hypothetical protein
LYASAIIIIVVVVVVVVVVVIIIIIIIRVIKSRRMLWTGHKACMRVMRNEYRILVGEPEGNRQRGRLCID